MSSTAIKLWPAASSGVGYPIKISSPPRGGPPNYSFQMWRLLATRDVKASCLNKRLWHRHYTRHVVAEDAQFKARLRHSYLCAHHYFSKFCPSSVIPSTFPLFPIPNSCYPNWKRCDNSCFTTLIQLIIPVFLNIYFADRASQYIYLNINQLGGRERSVQGAGGETRGEETAGETQA